MSERTLEKASQIVEAAEKEPGRFGPLVEEMDRTGRVSGVHRKLKVQRQVEAIKKEPRPTPAGPVPSLPKSPRSNAPACQIPCPVLLERLATH